MFNILNYYKVLTVKLQNTTNKTKIKHKLFNYDRNFNSKIYQESFLFFKNCTNKKKTEHKKYI